MFLVWKERHPTNVYHEMADWPCHFLGRWFVRADNFYLGLYPLFRYLQGNSDGSSSVSFNWGMNYWPPISSHQNVERVQICPILSWWESATNKRVWELRRKFRNGNYQLQMRFLIRPKNIDVIAMVMWERLFVLLQQPSSFKVHSSLIMTHMTISLPFYQMVYDYQ